MNRLYENKWAILMIVTLVSFVTNVDATIVVIGLPTVISDLHVNLVTGMWFISSYLITSTIFLLPAGRLADIIGTKRVFLWGFGIFTLATVMCGLANTGHMLIIFRLIQGLGAALALATATPIMIQTFPKEQLGLAIGINSTSWVVGSILGPILGGALISKFGWQSIFFVSAPFGLIALTGGWMLLKRTSNQNSIKMDWIGTLTFGLGLSFILVLLSQGQTWGWTSSIVRWFLVGAGLCWFSFIMTELRVEAPLFNLKLFTNKLYSTGLAITICYCIGYFSITVLLSLYMQSAQGLSPLESGMLLIPLSLPQLVMGPLGGKLADRFGPIRLLIVGLALIACSLLVLGTIDTHLSYPNIIIPLFVISIANGLAWPSLAKTVLSAAPTKEAGAASGMFYTVYNIGRVISQTLTLIIIQIGVVPKVASTMLDGIRSETNKLSLVYVTDLGFRIYTVFFIIALLLGILLKRHQTKRELLISMATETRGQ